MHLYGSSFFLVQFSGSLSLGLSSVTILIVEYAERRRKHGILFIFSLLCTGSVMYRNSQAEYIIYFRVAASQEYVNTYSTRRMTMIYGPYPCVPARPFSLGSRAPSG